MGCAVHFLEYSAALAGCIRFGIANGGLQIPPMSVLSWISPFFEARVRHSRYVGTLNDAAPYSFAHPRRCWRGHVAEYSVFCTGQDGVPQENAAVSSKYMQSVPGIMQTEKAGSMGWCIGLPSAPKRGAPPHAPYTLSECENGLTCCLA